MRNKIAKMENGVKENEDYEKSQHSTATRLERNVNNRERETFTFSPSPSPPRLRFVTSIKPHFSINLFSLFLKHATSFNGLRRFIFLIPSIPIFSTAHHSINIHYEERRASPDSLWDFPY